MYIWHNNTFIDEKDFYISPVDRGLTLGDGVFDTLLVVDGALQYADAHFNRLLDHAAAFAIQTGLGVDVLKDTARQLLEKNDFMKGRYALRTTVTRGNGMRGLAPPENPEPQIFMRIAPAPSTEDLPPVFAFISDKVRRNDHSPLSRIKTIDYADNILALMEAKERGGNEAIILNSRDYVCCATTSNIFIYEGERIITPPLSDGVMDGVTRAEFIKEHEVTEQSIPSARLMQADKIILTNSITGIRQVKTLNGKNWD